MRTICLNVTPLSRKITGIERCLYENVKRIDLLADSNDIQIELLCPKGVGLNLPVLHNLKLVRLKAKGDKIDYLDLRNYLRSGNRVYFSMHGGICLTRNSVICINDMRSWIHKEFDPLPFRMKCNINAITSKVMRAKIVTISETAREEISSSLHIQKESIKIIYPGWEHVKDFKPDKSVWKKIPLVEPKKYYYSLSSRAPHKNFIWIEEIARRHPDMTFVIGGKPWLQDKEKTNQLSNLHYIGYVTDEENVELMMNCKAFLHPSKYEGFGITPLEALACGATICVSNTSCLPEIFADCAHYFDPDNYEVDLEELLKQPVSKADRLLEKYSWKKSSSQWYELMRECSLL